MLRIKNKYKYLSTYLPFYHSNNELKQNTILTMPKRKTDNNNNNKDNNKIQKVDNDKPSSFFGINITHTSELTLNEPTNVKEERKTLHIDPC